MAIGFGAGSDMMGAYNSNRKQLKRSKNLKEVSETYGLKNQNKKVKYKETSEEQLKEFRMKLQEQKRKDTLRLYSVLGIMAVAFTLVMFYILFR